MEQKQKDASQDAENSFTSGNFVFNAIKITEKSKN